MILEARRTLILILAIIAGSASAMPPLLERNGFTPERHAVVLAWQEHCANDDGVLVSAFRVRNRQTNDAQDLYFSPNGERLDGDALTQHRIVPKRWNGTPHQAYAHTASQTRSRANEANAAAALASAIEPGRWIELAPLDDEALWDDGLAESLCKSSARTGVFRALPGFKAPTAGADSPQWRTMTDDSYLWSVGIYSPGATAIRVHLAALSLPRGGSVVVYNADDPSEAYGPYTASASADGDLWSASCFSDSVVVECRLPANSDPALATLDIDRIVHGYTDFKQLVATKTAGTCNNDVACYDEWRTVAAGVAHITYISVGGSYMCTGTLLADTESDTDVPYFLTANHCVSGVGEADTVEAYWFYEADYCDGTVPHPSTVPRTTGGADYLVGSSEYGGTDFALLRLRQAPPAAATFVGWTSNVPLNGTDIVGIHHPQGDFKRISFGDVTENVGSTLSSERFHEVVWHDGTTEGGSSGSPLLLASTGQVVGQLWGGYASCSASSEPDYYGRFDVTFALARPWLMPEPNANDVNGSGSVDAVDVQLTINGALGLDTPYFADVDDSGTVDAIDVQRVINAELGLYQAPK